MSMVKKFAAVLIAASMFTAPALAQGTATQAPAAQAGKAASTTPAGATKMIKKHKKAKHAKHVRHVKHVKHAKKVRHHQVARTVAAKAPKTVVAKPMTAPAAAPSRTN
jgi:hypothetical protein